jgi:uncharacterized protein YcaQ
MERISIQTARQMLLAAQGLERAPQGPATKDDVLEAIRRMYVLQIDTIHVVNRSPYLVLWSRTGDYQTQWLEELLAEGKLFEYWAHAICFLPTEDYPLYRRKMLDAIKETKWPVKWAVKFIKEKPELIKRIRGHMRTNGAVRSADFENKDRPPGGWWNWKEEKDALESLFFTGEIMIARRQNFQRVYDLRERVLKPMDEKSIPSSKELFRIFVLRAVKALGVGFPTWVSDYFRQPRTGIAQQLEALADEGLLHRVEVEGLKGTAYVHAERMGLLAEASAGKRQSQLTTILSPFDPVVWDRQRARELFNFDYTIEVYTPALKRKYGYFSMPILHNGELVGRLDPKAHRADGIFEVRAIHLEPGVKGTPELAQGLADVLCRIAAWHKTPKVVVRETQPPGFAGKLKKAIKATQQ